MKHTDECLAYAAQTGKAYCIAPCAEARGAGYKQELKPGLYEHYKGGRYIALNLVTHHDTGEKFVVYVSLTHGTLRLREWDTPGKDSWCDEVEYKTECVGSSPIKAPRFKYVGPAR